MQKFVGVKSACDSLSGRKQHAIQRSMASGFMAVILSLRFETRKTLEVMELRKRSKLTRFEPDEWGFCFPRRTGRSKEAPKPACRGEVQPLRRPEVRFRGCSS